MKGDALRVMGQCKAPAILKDGLLLDLIPFKSSMQILLSAPGQHGPKSGDVTK